MANDRPMPETPFRPGNQLWKLRDPAKGHRPLTYTADELRQKCIEYFEWALSSPIMELKAFQTKSGIETVSLPHMRALTVGGLAVHIGIGVRSWADWRVHPELKEVVEWADEIIYEQKFTGAAAGVLDAGFIGRALGLADRREVSGPDGGPIRTELSARERIAGKLAGLNLGGSAPEDTGEPD